MRLKQRVVDYEEDVGQEMREAAEMIVGPPEALAAVVRDAAAQLGSGNTVFTKAQLKSVLRSPALGLSKQQADLAVSGVTFDSGGAVSVETLDACLYDLLVREVANALRMQDLGELGAELTRLFEHYDKGGTGHLDKKVFKMALTQNYAYVTRLQVTALLNDAPLNEAGQVAWKEFLPKLTAMLKAFGDPEAIRERVEMQARAEFQPVEMMSHLDQKSFEETIETLFNEADHDGNGVLDVHEFHRCLSGADLGLTGDEIADLMEFFDTDKDAMVSLPEFKRLAYDQLANLSRERAIMRAMGSADGY
jgi:Ca2+-binding EF-hand superfamily protein